MSLFFFYFTKTIIVLNKTPSQKKNKQYLDFYLMCIEMTVDHVKSCHTMIQWRIYSLVNLFITIPNRHMFIYEWLSSRHSYYSDQAVTQYHGSNSPHLPLLPLYLVLYVAISGYYCCIWLYIPTLFFLLYSFRRP